MSRDAGRPLDDLLVGESTVMRQLKRLIRQLSPLDLPVMVEGETGTGKELVAQALHMLSGRTGPIISVSASEYPEGLLEAALFGHARGAFTGAQRDEPGLLSAARDGTLFLDEIATMEMRTQAKLLRVIETKTWRRLGETTERRGAFRVVAATNVPLADLVARGVFRADLAYRLRGVRVAIPPLRARGRDVCLLAHHFASRIRRPDGRAVTLGADALGLLQSRRWGGNVRELRATVEAAAHLGQDGCIGALDVACILATTSAGRPQWTTRTEAVSDALARHAGDADAAAKTLGVSRATLYRRAQAEGIRVSSFRERE